MRSYFVTHGLDVRTTRCCNNYGKYQFPEKVIPVFIHKIISGQKLPIYGDGSNVREWIHVNDHSFGIQFALENGAPGEIYNIGSGFHLSNNELAEYIIGILDRENHTKEYVQDRKGHDLRYAIDSKKIESLGFVAHTDFAEGLKETIDWYTTNPAWWSKWDLETKT